MRKRLIALTIAILAGCAGQPISGPETIPPAPAPRAPTAAAPGVNLSGYPAAFRAGYVDGCNSVDGVRKRDDVRFKNETDYAQGWRDGNDICKRRK